MIRTIGMLELRSIAKGIESADAMLKAAQVDLIFNRTTCPGKYMIIVSGDVGSVKEAVDRGIEIAGKYLVESFILPSVHCDVVDGIKGIKKGFNATNAIGIFETITITAGIFALDASLKSGQVSLIKINLGAAIGGKSYFVVSGEVSSVVEALRAAENSIEQRKILEKAIIPHPSQELMKTLI